MRFTGNCAPGDGKCECAEAYRGDVDCKTCADGYYDDGTSTDEYPNCKQVLQIHIFKPRSFSNLKKIKKCFQSNWLPMLSLHSWGIMVDITVKKQIC